MKYTPRVLALLLVLFVLTGCSQSQETQPTETTTEATQATTAATEAPTQDTEPPTQTQAVEISVVLDPGPSVYVDGISITSTGLNGETVYVSATEFCAALGGETYADGTATLDYNEVHYTFSPEYEHIMRGEKATVLLSPVVNFLNQAYLPLEEMCELMQISVFWDTEENTVYCTPAAWAGEIAEGYNVPVLMYHAVDNDLWGIDELFVKPENMADQLQWLNDNGYETIFFEDLYHIEDYEKPVLLTFDDGYLDNYAQLFPLLQEYNCKATIFVIQQYIDNDEHYMTTVQVREMAASGLVSIQSHTVTHPYLSDLDIEEQRYELEQSKLLITRMTLREPYVLCYPTGKYNSDTLEIIGDSYQFGIKMNGGLYNTSDSPFEINRYYISRDTGMSSFEAKVSEGFDD